MGTVGGRRGKSALSSDLLCAFHTKQQLLSSRSPCPRRGGQAELPCGTVLPAPSPHGSGDGQGQQRAGVCAAAYSASAGQPGSAPLRAGWLGALERFWYYYKEIIQRAALTLGLLVVIRCGSFIPVPGVDLAAVPAAAAATAGERLIKALYGQAQDIPASLFDLGISPFVNASIVMAIALVLPPEVSQLPGMGWLGRLRDARKEGRTGEAVINSASHTLALGFAVYAALLRALELEPCALAGGGGLFGFVPLTMLGLVAGSCCIHMCASTITAFGLGNGSSLVICAGIITEYATTLHTVLAALDTALLAPGRLLAVLGGYLALVLGCVWLATSELRLPVVQYAASAPPPPDAKSPGAGGGLQELIAQARLLGQRKSAERAALSARGGAAATAAAGGPGGGAVGAAAGAAVGSGSGGGAGASGVSPSSEYFPLQLNSSGMMSIVLAGAAYFGFLPKLMELTTGDPAVAMAVAAAQLTPLGLAGYGLTVFALEFLPLGGVNPKEMAEYFNTMNVGLRGVIPGEPTERELRTKLLQCKFWGGACLCVLAVAAQLYDMACVQALGTSLGTTSLLIIVGAVLQTARQVEGLLEGPKLQRKLDQERAAIQSLSLL
ncbi:hypothetical protein HYH02_000865 [Chlamydomonas schloesseri]|uniref:Uncharacterized protein n=1 Tax=Chlamydomonas schloesseri TaxID=2026947 RepID=A0A835WZD9_9CHLO|nr:hypothetical protein HYH02_000865 [Chlamydomonas schloesseri]|eukprot:KAG2455040.1 hypothetical protein HYH02_000865 [Chlamydomonas schloesseri]